MLLRAGYAPHIARACVTHAEWSDARAALEDRLIALADKLWKGKRDADLERALVDELADRLSRPTWEIFDVFDALCERIAAAGPDRLRRSTVWERGRVPPRAVGSRSGPAALACSSGSGRGRRADPDVTSSRVYDGRMLTWSSMKPEVTLSRPAIEILAYGAAGSVEECLARGARWTLLRLAERRVAIVAIPRYPRSGRGSARVREDPRRVGHDRAPRRPG
jgi:hypothetical protein